MRSSRLRSLLLTAVLLAFGGLGWFYLAPTQIGGSTHYVITHGISMEPMLHTGDLALVRPVSDYRVGQVVAYHSTLLHTVVLHRIIRIAGGHYTFKGINNSFIDPTHPTRAMLIGAMWLHIPHGGTVLNWIHKPWVAAALSGAVAMMLLFGGEQQRRRRRRRGRQPAATTPRHPRGPNPLIGRRLAAVAAAIALLFAGLGVYAFLRPVRSVSSTSIPYAQQVSYGYSAHVKPGPVYPSGVVTTGDPLYSPLVRDLKVTASYRLSSTSLPTLKGTVRLRGTVANSSGWSRSFWLGPAAPIKAGHALATANVPLGQFDALVNRVTTQIGLAAGSYALTIVPQVTLSGEVGGQPFSNIAQPPLSLDLSGSQLLSGSSASGSTAANPALVHTTAGSVSTSHSTVDTLASVPIRTVRVVGIAGLALFATLALLLALRAPGVRPEPAERINRRYKHLIVPVSEIHTSPDNPPIEVRTIEALAQLAERSERLILHDQQPDVDNYLIDDQGTLFRFQALRLNHSNGNGRGQHEPVGAQAAVAASQAASAAGKAPPEPNASTGAPALGNAGLSESSADSAAEPAADADLAAEGADVAVHVNGFAPLSDPIEDAEAIRLSRKVTPVVQGPQARRPPIPSYSHWSQRPEVRVGFTLGPLLTLLAVMRVRARRAERRSTEVEEQRLSAERRRSGGHQPPPRATRDRSRPQRAPGDRRRGERRRNR